MKITLSEARKRLAKAGIELGNRCSVSDSRRSYLYEVTTPVGTQVQMQTSDVAGLLRDLDRAAM
ncbi:MAG: hypothetical protein AAGG48_22005 [Planctomycetota bacterium]